jgi:thioredoxin reductase (NADPH)
MAERALAHPKISVEWNTVPVEAKGDGKLLSAVSLADTKNAGSKRDLAVKGLFYAIGHEPNTAMLKNNDKNESPIALDSTGYILVKPGTSLTNVEGVFACGDVQDKR